MTAVNIRTQRMAKSCRPVDDYTDYIRVIGKSKNIIVEYLVDYRQHPYLHPRYSICNSHIEKCL